MARKLAKSTVERYRKRLEEEKERLEELIEEARVELEEARQTESSGERSPDREPFTTLETYRKTEKGAMFGQNLVNDGIGRLEVGMPVTVLE